MKSNKTNWITLAIALCLVILQVLQPFIHGHLDLDHPIQKVGFHLMESHEEFTASSNITTEHTLSDVTHTSHAVAVASGIKQDADPALAADLFSFVLLSLCFAIFLPSIPRYFPQLAPVLSKSLKRRLPAPRAPPLF